ncbi:MAG TPA: bifunctional metallophosphatase/5'-nucleotidase [Polyangia bacterium]|nr:bifunctional metallophosphatase/5'-nucleotidase [Polyangia bacterium]
MLMHFARACGKALPLLLLVGVGCGSSSPSETSDGGNADGGNADGGGDVALGPAQKLVILHTNDLHSHLEGFAPEGDYSPSTTNDDLTVGGIARLATAIGGARMAAGDRPVMLVDAGDFMMGTLFETLATTNPPELAFMKGMAFDATTIGNHELDWTPKGLAGLLNAAAMAGNLIPIVASNMHFSDSDPGDDDLKMLVDATQVIQPKLIKMYGTLKVGFFGLLGADAVRVTPQAKPLTFDTIEIAAAAMVKELRETDKVDLIVALSHSGISADGTGEDADLASLVPDIDIIISGHTHDKLDQPKIVGKTVIVTAGSYGQYLGELEVTVTPGAATPVAVDKYTLLPIDDQIPGDANTETDVQAFIAGIDMGLAAKGVPTYKMPIAVSAFDLPLPMFAEAPVGDLVTDAYRTIVSALQPDRAVDLAVEANGQLRAPIIRGTTGQVWMADMFRVLPIGIGPDGVPGYPLVTFYLTPKDIRSGLELNAASGSLLPDQYFLQISGMKTTYDTSKPVFGRVTSLGKVNADGSVMDLALDDTTTCLKVVATSYVAGLLGLLKSLSGNVLDVTAKASDCVTPIDPTVEAAFVDADPTTDGTQELKHWTALLKYMTSFKDANGAPLPIPQVYSAPQGRITKQP